MRLLFDLETDDLLDAVTRIWCVVARDLDTNEEYVFGPDKIEEGLALLRSADLLAGHNIAKYDLPVLQKLVRFRRPPKGALIDTLLWSRASYPQLKVDDLRKLHRNPTWVPKNLIGMHSLEAWGHRLGERKGSVENNDFSRFTPAMLEYCRQDVKLNVVLFNHLATRGAVSQDAARLESEVGWLLGRQERHGIRFDTAAAVELHAKLAARKAELEQKLQGLFAPWYVPNGVTVAKRGNKKLGIAPGAEYTKIKLVHFNPGSRDHIANRLQKVYGWQPQKWTDGGKRPAVDETVLSALPWPECQPLAEYMLLEKRLGQIAGGEKAWLKLERGGRIHGTVHPTGARTSRMSHTNPNLAQVPKVGSPYGEECRALFLADKDWVLVGADASGLEMRMLGHYLARWDGGAFAREVVEGDVHTYMMRFTGITDRNVQKTWTYARLYGAGNAKLGKIMGCSPSKAGLVAKQVEKRMPAMAMLSGALDAAFKRGYVLLPDGRHAPTASRHDTLNTLLQGAGAIVLKVALVIADSLMQDRGLQPAQERGERARAPQYEFVLNVHDEWQVTCHPSVVDTVKASLLDAMRIAGEVLGMRVRIDGEAKAGANWKETH